MSTIKRIQLTLFLPENFSKEIEQIRMRYNPIQYALIRSHVTLCREDELMEVDTIKETLRELHHRPILIDFDLPLRFSGGSGVLIPSKQKNPEFDNLRKALLSKWTGEPRSHQAHITLIHPRNSKCTDEIFAEISRLEFPNRILFNSISLIEQEDNKPWVVLEEYQLVD